MVSSEVQRTLVKSPPELWSELSDPAALARHLGEFGEIRITRVEAESAIEWESDSAAGAVLIKPSGWGTRVTLRATRELPGADAGETDAALQSPAPAASEPASRPQAEPKPAPVAESHAEPAPEAAHAAPEAAHAAPDAMAWAAPLAPAAETWAAQLSWAATDAAAQLAHELEDDLTHQPPVDPLEMRHEQEPPARLGFFARLFRRRRSAAPGAGESAEQLAEPAAPLGETLSAADPLDRPDEDADHDAVEAADASSSQEQSAEAAGPAPLPEPEAFEPGPLESRPQADPSARESDGLAGRPQDAQLAQDAQIAQDADVPQAADAAQETAGSSEKITEEALTAVLSSMLDRLGTAHHRPFSRA